MGKKQQSEKASFEVIREGHARARFGGQFSGAVIPGESGSINLAVLTDNAGYDPAEYFACMARLLSAAITPYRKFDFITRPGVLQDAVPLFDGLTLYANHWADVESWKGFIKAPVWDDQNTPHGINAMVVLDRIVDPKLARGVETKALRSFSVTIWFDFEKSHPNLANFWDRLGEEVDGEIVRLIVTRIINAGEVSVVWEGEDPYAKSFEAGGDTPEQTTEEDTTMKLSAATLALLAIPAGTELTEDLLEAKIGETLTGLKTKVAELEPAATLGRQILTETRTTAATLYKAAKGEKFQQAFIDGVIEKADLATARALCTEYEAEVEKTVPLACPKCGEKLARRSSRESDPETFATDGKRVEDYKV